MEIVIYNLLQDFITKHNILHKYQFVFRKQNCTSHAMISLVEKLHNALDQGIIAITCFLDLKTTFDTVNHSILISKLYKNGIRGPTLEWFKLPK